MNFLSKILGLILIVSGGLSAHEHWLFTEAPSYAKGDSVHIFLRSGHTPGKSEFQIKTALIQEAFVINPLGQSTSLYFSPHDLEHHGTFVAEISGSYTIHVNLRKRSKGPFTYLLKTEIQVDTSGEKTGATLPQELEIIHDGASLSFQVFQVGEAVKVPISLISSGQTGRSLVMDRNGISQIEGQQSGFQIVVCHYRRQTASLSFYLDD